MRKAALLFLTAALLLVTGCGSQASDAQSIQGFTILNLTGTPLPEQETPTLWLPATRAPGAPYETPTPNMPRVLPTPRADEEFYTVQYGDSLAEIANRYNLELAHLLTANDLMDPDQIGRAHV